MKRVRAVGARANTENRIMADTNGDSSKDEPTWAEQIAADELAIAQLLAESQDNNGPALKLDDDTPFDQTNKADDAQDFEDISDDELPEEEETTAGQSAELPGLTEDGGTSADADDLFGEGPSSPLEIMGDEHSPDTRLRDLDDAEGGDDAIDFSVNFDPEPHMFGRNQDPNIPAPAETIEEVVRATWPAFRKGHVMTWSELLPPKRAFWKEKKPLKKPKHLVTSKLSLELAPDEEKQFLIPGTANASHKNRIHGLMYKRMVPCGPDDLKTAAKAEDTFDIDRESDTASLHGFSFDDIVMACEDWSNTIESAQEGFDKQVAQEEAARKRNVDADDDWDVEFLQGDDRQAKKRRPNPKGLPYMPRYTAPNFDNFEEATKRGAKHIHLDVTDPHLLIEPEAITAALRAHLGEPATKRPANFAKAITKRFNMSNDEAYDLLKENHQSKVRGNLSLITVEHSLPADRLCWPFYKTKLPGTTDEYHRPRFRYRKFVGHPIRFEKVTHMKRKAMRGKTHDVFKKSKDLTLGDNSTAVLMEYCERRPRVLNGFGMGSKIINYYRRHEANEEDNLPKTELGEYRTLLPEDRSPFSLFGSVDPGEVVPTLHNEMYRAPLFKHDVRKNDFLIVRSSTGVDGSHWHLRKIDHVHVVGQTFPAVEVPGPHSRKVTTTSKNRMKMIAFRMIRHSATDNFNLSAMTRHISDSTDTQNRQKLKEFLQHDKHSSERGMWKLRDGDVLPDEIAIRAMIKPEDVCLQDAMQLGIKELEDAGYDPRNANLDEDAAKDDDDDDDDDDLGKPKGGRYATEKHEETLAEKKSPWVTTKAFMDACSQKAMLQLHGEGDPTGHGLGFSFMRTSMKGGYVEKMMGPNATSADAIERERRMNGGHAYNVKRQQAMYEEGIREIWDKQKATLSDRTEHDDKDVQTTEDEDKRFDVNVGRPSATPAPFEEGVSMISGMTTASRHAKRAIRINRKVRMSDGSTKIVSEIVQDPVVITQYLKRRNEVELQDKEYVEPSSSSPEKKRGGKQKSASKPMTLHSFTKHTHAAPGSQTDLVGLEFKAPAYLISPTVFTRPCPPATPKATDFSISGTSRNQAPRVLF